MNHQHSQLRTFRIGHPALRAAMGLTAATAALCAGGLLFGPVSDLRARQLAAGPSATHPGPDGQPIIMARSSESWAPARAEKLARARLLEERTNTATP
jgi:hypothetical protein